jgi:L1 cell adhesion molecule like protein
LSSQSSIFQICEKRNILIFDLGGGTFDVSILTIQDGRYEVKATAGNTHLGGEDFDNRMVDHFVQEFKRKHQKDLTTNKRAVSKLRTACERAKRMLSVSSQGSIEIDFLFDGIDFYTSINHAKFDELNADLLFSTINVVEDSLRDAKMDKKQIDDIVLVGGSTRIPMVQKLLQGFVNGKELNILMNRDEAVAYGAAVQAAILSGDKSKELQGLVILDVNTFSLGIETDGGVKPVIIKCNTPIPTQQSNTYATQCDNQSNISFDVYEYELTTTKKKASLGKFEITGIPPAPRGVSEIELTFNIDANGILKVTAVENSNGRKNNTTGINDKGRISSKEFERMKGDAEKNRAEDEMRKQTNSAQHALESYCFNMKSSVEDKTLKDKIPKTDKNTILDKCNEVIRWLDDNQLAEKEALESQQKELESVCNPIINRVQGLQVQGTSSSNWWKIWRWIPNMSGTNN